MEKKLSAWCKNAKIEMINRDLKTTTLAKELDMNRSYVSSILNGRVYSAPAVKKISDYLGIVDSDTTTVWIGSRISRTAHFMRNSQTGSKIRTAKKSFRIFRKIAMRRR